MHKVLVIPSVREASFRKFVRSWEATGDWDDMILVEDNPEPTFPTQGIHHFSWKDIDAELGEKSWIISRRDSSIRSFGFLKAYQMGADCILTLDDDCYPFDETPICAAHLAAMDATPRWIESVPNMRTRGLPYFNRGTLGNVVANMGFWSKIPDLDSVQSLNNSEIATGGGFLPPPGSRIIPRGQYFPLCGMNFAFRRSVASLGFFPLMGKNSPYNRFDDIWFGIIFKRICDHLGLNISVGTPFIEHQRASDTMTNLVKEAPGIAANEHFWEKVDAAPLTACLPVECMAELGEHLARNSDQYVKLTGNAIMAWSSLF